MNQRFGYLLKSLAVGVLLLFSIDSYGQCSGVSASFNVNATGCGIPRNYTFTNNSTGSYSSSATYIWRNGSTDVDTTTGTGSSPTVTITAPGNDTIWLVAIDSNGCRDSTFQILNTTTTANAVYDPSTGTYNYSPLWENCILFLTSPDSFRIYMQANGTLSNYTVIWGDGNQDTGTTLNAFTDLTHLYLNLGTYTVQIVSQNGSCFDTIQGSVVNERIPTAGIVGPPAGGNVGCAPHTVRFINNSTNVSSSTVFRWDFGDGTILTLPYTTAQDTIYHTYTAGLCNGVVSVQAINPCGSSTATWTPIYVNDRDDASWTMNTVNCNPSLPFTFFNTSTNNYCTPTTRLFYWDFGDGTNTGWINTTTPQNHIFPRPGRYTVTLYDSNLCGIDSFSQVVIIDFVPDAGFIYSNPNGCSPVVVTVIDTTAGLSNVRIWNFGNGVTSSDSLDTAYYTTPGTYNLSLSVVNSCGSDVANLTVTVWAPPDAAFASISSGCSPLDVTFTNTSTYFNDSTVTWEWDFGDGTDTTIQHPPPKTYTTPGTYTVWLYVYDTCGVDSFSRTFTVHPKPDADFSADTVCFGNPTSFTNGSTVLSGTINQFSWRFGNPSQGTSSLSDPTFTFNTADTFLVQLIAETDNSCLDTLEKEVIVLSNPIVSWAVSPNDTVCIGDAQSFDGTANAVSGTISSYFWDFGNGETSSQEDTVLTYGVAGNYSVDFIVSNSFGCMDTATGNIVVLPLPTVAFSADTACVGSVTQFQDNSTVNPGSIASRRWDLNADDIFDSTSVNPTRVYITLGSRWVKLEVTSDFGCVNLDSNLITVHPLPVPSISVDSSVICMGDSITLTNSSTNAVSYTYDFGDGSSLSTSSSAPIRHAYSDSGAYVIRVYAYSDRGCVDSGDVTVTVRPTPLAHFTVNQQIACAPFTFIFTNSSLRSTDYLWFSDGNFASTATNRPDTLISLDSQTFTISLVAFNSGYSCPYDTFELNLGTSRNPIADFVTNPDSGCGPLTVAFGNTSQFASSFFWDFRNGETSSSQDTSMSFDAALFNDSTYTIKLYAYNWQGCPDSTEQDIVVHPNPDVTFTQSNTDSCGSLTVSFTNTSTHYPGGSIADMTFNWTFSNGSSSTAQDTVIQFLADNINDEIYTVQLIGLNRYGCPDTATSTVRVYPNPVAQFTMSQADSCGPMGVSFTNTSFPNDTGTIADMTFSWNLGNGATGSTTHISTSYGASLIQDSVYTIQLIAFSEHGCPDTATNTVRVYPKPTAQYTQSDTSGCGPLVVTFGNTSIPYDTSAIGDMTFQWDFGNGITSTAQDTSVSFIAAGTSDTVYTVRLIAFSEHGCADTFTSTVRVHPGPVASFGVNQAIACAPFNFEFTNNSINSTNFYWAVDGVYGYNQTTRPDTLISSDTQSVLISLVAETSFGCPNDTADMVIGTSRNPIADFVTNPDSGCGPLTVAFGNTSQFASSFFWDFRNGETSSSQDTSMSFDAALFNDSTYTIKLYAYNWQGCPDSTERDIVVHPNPDVTFTQSNTDSCGPLTVSFTNTSTHYPGGSIADMTFNWTFSNGSSSTAQDTVIQFLADNINDEIYTVQLIGLNRYGCPDTATSTVRVYPNPVAQFTMSQADSCGPMGVSFTNTSFPNDTGTIADMTFSWNLGNGATGSTTHISTSYGASLIQDSVYTIQLIAFSEHGCPDTATNTVRVYPKPTAQYTQSDTSGCGPLVVTFGNTSIPYDTSAIGDMTFQWDFGNGITSTSQDESVSFVAASINDTVYTVRLIAFSEHGCADTVTSTVRVHPKPTVSLTKDDSIGCDPVSVNFTGSGVNVTVFHWDFGDSSTSTLQNPSHDFRAIPFDDTTYLVKLVGESPYGCLSDTITTTVTVLGGPYAEFYPSPDSVCATTSSQMINNSLGATSYLWDFGNGDTSSVVSPQALFLLNPAADTTYHIVMVASNLSGCRDTAEGYVVVSPIPTAAFTLDTDTGCSPHSVQFTDQSLFAISHAWAYSNGQSDTADDPVFSFTNSGIVDSVYLVRLIVTNLSGCTDTATDLVRVYPNPTADFVATPSSGCGDLTVSFSNQSTPNDTGSISIMSFEWDLGNGTNSTAQNPSTSYLRSQIQDSVYTITLIGSSEHGCRDTTSNTVRVFPQPLAQFSQSDTSDCGPLTVSFQNTSIPFDTGSIADMNFQWDFGNGFVGYDRHDTITFYPALVNDTVYTVRLIAFSEHGCRDTAYSTVRVHPTPLVDFSRTPTSGCSPLTVAFTSNTTNITSYFWDFGNGDTSTQANPSAIFNNVLDIDTVFTITLSGESLYGCPSDSATRTVIVRPDPVAAFTQSEDSVCGTTTIVFSNASTGANSYAWNFGDGSTAANTHPQHSFSMNPLADTTYTVRLIASSFHNCRDTVLGSVTIFPFPTAVIETDTSMGCNPLTVNFSHTSLLSTGFAWDFGNGNTSTSQTPSSVFTNNTLYDTLFSVELLVSSVHGCVDSTTTMIRVFPDPTVEFVAQPTSGCGDLTVNFNNQSTPNDTGSIAIMSFNWDLGNGSTSTATHPSSLYLRALTQDSIYTVELIGTSEHGCRDTVSHDVRTFPKPLADFTQSDTSGCGPLTVSFTNISIPYDTGSINDMSFFWDFGNGLGSTNRNESTVYYPSLTQDTVYTVRLIALSEHGCRDTMYSTVRVHPDPNISYTQTPSSGCSPLTVNFNATGLNVQSWHWDFADGDTSTQEDPIEVFLGRPDFDTTYAVTLSAVSAYGCLSDTLTSNVVVRLMPVASFVKSNDSICGPTTIFFTNQSTGANAYSWSFGDGGTSGTANPSHAYSMNPTVDTTYIVRLIATNFYNCRDTTFDSVSIFPYPTAVIVTDTSMGCNPLTVNFSHNSLLSTGFAWDFGNGNTSTSQTPSSVFTNSTLYDTLYSVELLVSSVHGCVDSTTRTIRVFPDPTVEFVAQPTSGCGDLTVNFNNQSTPNDTGSIAIMSFNWDLGNGSSSTATHPSSLYLRALTQDSIYTVELIGTSEHGCRDSVSHDVRTFPKPLANFTQSDTSGCGPLTVSFTNISIPYDTGSINDMSFFWDFGNGSGSTNRNESMVFYPSLTQDTVYTIRLIALSEHGCRDTMFSTVRVHPDPNINFTPDLTSGCGPLPVQFSSSVLNVGTYYWDFGDGDTSHQANPLHSFQNRPDLDTSYTVRFWGQSSYGCWSDTVSQVIIVRPDPVANFSQNLDSLCGGGLIQFSNNSTLGYTYQWDFGDGSATTTAVNPQHTFVEVPFTDTQYPVQLIATSVYGCRDTLVKPTTIFPLPDAQITHAPDSGCSPLLVQFGNLSTIAASHSWTFGDNSSAIGDTLQHLFTNPLGIDQDFQVIMQAVTVHGCIDRDTVSIRVHPLPRPNFVFNKTGICDTSEYNFSNLSAGALLYEWDFGDGTGSFQDDPSHIYPTAVSSDTTFVAKLIATTNRGCIDSISTPVTVTPIMLARASTNNASGCPPLEVDFINNSTNATSYYWDFGDGFVSTSATPSHTFINPDQSTRVYTVQLIVNNNFGCADTAEVQITVAPNIDANFIASKTSLCTVAEYDFVNLSVGSVDYQWDFGDGSNSTQSSPTHVFPTSLTQDTSFTVRLVARSSVNCYDTMYRTVTVHPIVTALFTVNNNEACGSMLAQFTNLSRNGNYHVWDFGDGSGTAQFSPSHAYFQIGTYYPSITVYDAYGCSATYTLPNPIIIWQVPQANFIATPTTQRLPAATFDFTNLSVAIDPLTYEWDFGDPGSGANNNSSLQDPQHTYSDSGTYVIRLIVDNGHCRDTIERTVRLEYYFPIASFRQDPDTGCMEHTVNFINESQYATSYRWFFGDGGQSTDENPTHTYVNPGIYTVSLIAYGPGGVDDTTKVDQIVVIQKPYANFYVTPFVAWMPNTTFTFVNTSLLATSYIWDIESPDGNDITTTDENPILDLNVEGEYSIRLIAINDYGCRDTAYRENLVRVNADGVLLVPDAFTPNGDGINDQFRPVFEGVERENYHFRVYNRWGELIFDTRDIDEAWDGTFQGKMCESEVYVWQVEGIYYGKQHFEQNGRVMLLR